MPFFPSECARVIDAIAAIYKHEAHCKAKQLTPAQRLAYHQANSREVMKELKAWMARQLEDNHACPLHAPPPDKYGTGLANVTRPGILEALTR